ncbi:hypothetical protein C922_05261 [Plasmodium inui San Antonio 1]|uniref:Uncharacterized protein n=1 Tax=Plasmodium inui San Antonio 1 TaxID=1237626 RepID=W6ZYE8_9APIC|nr:hypothetical protein C922_05261 [Plasmodium inui San Antonio 1]EUD64358.1 hypothetical protein C922_05261 [Plasmodium inui San Antonio 1]
MKTMGDLIREDLFHVEFKGAEEVKESSRRVESEVLSSRSIVSAITQIRPSAKEETKEQIKRKDKSTSQYKSWTNPPLTQKGNRKKQEEQRNIPTSKSVVAFASSTKRLNNIRAPPPS